MSILRKRNTQHKVYVPASARENQYLLAKFSVTDELMEKFSAATPLNSKQPYQEFYQELSKLFFSINEQLGIDSGQFVGNDKFVRVRFSPEKLTAQTEQQILFLYNPNYHFCQNAYFDPKVRASKITLVYLANGNDVRLDAVKFHQQVIKAIAMFAAQTGLQQDAIRVCDHQHLTYDLFAKDKGVSGTHAHKMRSLKDRYQAAGFRLPQVHDALTYAIVDLPMNRRIQQLVDTGTQSQTVYQVLYELIAGTFIDATKRFNLNHGALVANGLIPIVRKGQEMSVVTKGELQMMGYNPANNEGVINCIWDGDSLVDTIQLVLVASELNETHHGYASFLNHIEQALTAMAEHLGYIRDKEELIVRFHQHIGYYQIDN